MDIHYKCFYKNNKTQLTHTLCKDYHSCGQNTAISSIIKIFLKFHLRQPVSGHSIRCLKEVNR